MRPTIAAWMLRRGLPDWLLPDYWQLAAIAALIGSVIALRLAARDRASAAHTARAIAWAYAGAIAGGYLFEAVRAIPAAVAAHSFRPVLHPGRAAYGGLLCAIAAAAMYLRRVREPLAPFFDRVAIGAGVTFALVRTGCFLAGCDYGAPTALPWGVRFPRGSLAALDHLRRGFVPHGAASLPVHPTQLYEAGLGLLGAAAAALAIRRGRRDGRAFAAFLAVYAAGRFAIELLRGDRDRGAFLGLSTAQWVSLAIGAALVVWWRRARRERAAQSAGALSAVGTARANRSAKNSAGRPCAGSIEKSGTPAGARSLA
jgi:phosphatidylglycerol:prolipoprotein diacylglycerol transferase